MKDRRTRLLFLILLLVSLVLRIYRINQGLWYDEITTLLKFVRLPWSQILTSLPLPNNHLLFTLLAKLSIAILGEKEWTLRVPSLILGSLTPPLAYLVLRKKVEEASAFLTGAFLALSFWPVWFSQDARGYAGMMLFVLLSQVLYLEVMESKKMTTLAGYFLCTMLAGGFHLYAGFAVGAQIGLGYFNWVRDRRNNGVVGFVVPIIGLVLMLLIYVPGSFALTAFATTEGHEVAGRWFDMNFVRELIKLLAGTHLLAVSLALWAAALVGMIRLIKSWPGICLLYLVTAWLLVVSTLILHIFIYARFLAFMIPFFYLCLAHALSAPKSRLARIVLTVIVAAALAVSLGRYYRLGKQGFKTAAEYLEAQHPLEPVISLGLARNEFLYYMPEARPRFGQVALKPQAVRDTMVVASHPWSWAPWNKKMLEQTCRLEKTWPSAGYEENDVFLYNCPGPATPRPGL